MCDVHIPVYVAILWSMVDLPGPTSKENQLSPLEAVSDSLLPWPAWRLVNHVEWLGHVQATSAAVSS